MWRKSYILLNFSYARSDILVLFRAMREVTYLSYFALCLKKNSQLKQLHLKLVPKHSCAFSHNAIVNTCLVHFPYTQNYIAVLIYARGFTPCAKLHTYVYLHRTQHDIIVLFCVHILFIFEMRKVTYLCYFAPCAKWQNPAAVYTWCDCALECQNVEHRYFKGYLWLFCVPYNLTLTCHLVVFDLHHNVIVYVCTSFTTLYIKFIMQHIQSSQFKNDQAYL